jgi:hypothetical protein
MAILGSTLLKSSTSSTAISRTYTEMYHVTTDAPTTDLKSIVEYDGSGPDAGPKIPNYGAGFAYDRFSVVQSKSAENIDGTRTKFVVTVEYAPYDRSGHNSFEDEFDNPLDAPSQYTWGFVSRSLVVTHDINNNLIVNAADDLFVPAPEQTEYDLQLTVVQNLPEYADPYSFIGSVNSEEFTVAGYQVNKKEALCTERSATSEIFVEKESDTRIEYWQVTTVLVFRKGDAGWRDENDLLVGGADNSNGWFLRILNAGLNAYKVIEEGPPVVRKKVPIALDDNQEVKDPQLLTPDGQHETERLLANWIPAEIYGTEEFGLMRL